MACREYDELGLQFNDARNGRRLLRAQEKLTNEREEAMTKAEDSLLDQIAEHKTSHGCQRPKDIV
jgi:uncharacterized protein (DUF488 family)